MSSSRLGVVGDISATAVLTAHARAHESAREDRLFTDPLAAVFVEASQLIDESPDVAGAELSVGPVTFDKAGLRWVYESIAVRTKYLDDRLVDAVGSGLSQVVIPAAGLDARAFRLSCPASTTIFEIDLPKVFDFKESVLGAVDVAPSGIRHTVATDLTGLWVDELRGAGFDPSLPTVWILEGILMYLSNAECDKLLADLSSVSAEGSELLFFSFAAGAAAEQQTRQLSGKAESVGYGWRSHIEDPRKWVARCGWTTVEEPISIKAFGRQFGRDVPNDEEKFGPITWLVRARRAS